MNLEKVIFAFFSILALTLNFGFFIGELDDPMHHNAYELFAALIVSLIATIMKFGDRAHIGELITAALVWGYAVNISDAGLTPMAVASIVSMSGGALLANLVSVILLIIESITFRR